jgi:ABC-type phosphonate transport system ATPase subunit
VIVFLVSVVLHRYLGSTYGYVGDAIRQNEIRVEYLGASVRNVIHKVYVIARKILDIAMATVGAPQLVMLDEPTSGVSAEEKFEVMDIVMDAFARQEVTVSLVIWKDLAKLPVTSERKHPGFPSRLLRMQL